MSAPTYTADQLIALSKVIGSAPQMLLVLALAENNAGTKHLSWLAERTRQSTAGITGLVDGLEKHGWVERLRHARDRRQVLVRLTKKCLARLEDERP